MEFDPTYDYSQNDLRIDENLVCWRFTELIKTLITLSCEAEEQEYITGVGFPSEEMAVDYDNYFTSSKSNYITNQLIDEKQLMAMEDLDNFFAERSGAGAFPSFWDDWKEHKDWDAVRKKAKQVLQLLGMQNLRVIVERAERHLQTSAGKTVAIQTTKLKIVKKVV